MPKRYESDQSIGTVKPEIAKASGIPETAKVCAGAEEKAAAAVGAGVVGCNISLAGENIDIAK